MVSFCSHLNLQWHRTISDSLCYIQGCTRSRDCNTSFGILLQIFDLLLLMFALSLLMHDSSFSNTVSQNIKISVMWVGHRQRVPTTGRWPVFKFKSVSPLEWFLAPWFLWDNLTTIECQGATIVDMSVSIALAPDYVLPPAATAQPVRSLRDVHSSVWPATKQPSQPPLLAGWWKQKPNRCWVSVSEGGGCCERHVG